MKKLIFACLAFSLAFTACKKNKDVIEPAHQNLVTKRTDNDGLTFTYTYDASNKMIAYTQSANPSNAPRNYTFTYNTNGSLAEFFESISQNKGKYTYNTDGTVNTQKEYSVSGATETLVNTYTFTYVAGVVIQNYIYAPTGNGWRQEYKYNANGNLIEVKSYTTTPANPAGTYSGVVTYGNYDTKNTPGSSFPAAFSFPGYGKNNVGSIVYSFGTVNYTYEYNADGYPIKRIDGTSISIYEYKRL